MGRALCDAGVSTPTVTPGGPEAARPTSTVKNRL